MSDTSGTQHIKALGRPVYLAQLYNARTGAFINGFRLFHADQVTANSHSVKVTTANTSQKEIKSVNDRTSSLDVSAELEVSILGGAITIGGSGSYLNSKADTTESCTVALIAKYRTHTDNLDVNALLNNTGAMSSDELARTGATHFVTSITYGGDVVGSLTQTSANRNDNTNVKGSFSLEAFKGLGKAFGASGKAELSLEEKEAINSFSLEVSLVADISLKDEEVPTTPSDMITLFKKSGQLVGDGIACEVDLLPLTMVQSEIPTYRELQSTELKEISRVYNKIIKLDNSRLWLTDMVAAKQELFPSFYADLNAHTLAVSALVEKARADLRVYLEAYRGDKAGTQAPSKFKADIEQGFTESERQYEEDLAKWRDLQERTRAAQEHKFPVVTVSELTSKMNRTDKGVIALVMVPEKLKFVDLLETYQVLASDIRQWRASVDKPKDEENGTPSASPTEYLTLYADEKRDAALLRLDDSTNSLSSALDRVRKTEQIVFLTYGIGNDVHGLSWNLLNEEGWGIIVNKEEHWRYVGDVHKGVPHGSGIMSFVDKTKYVGEWVQGRREGEGEFLDQKGNDVPGKKGVYLRDVLDSAAVVVVLKVINKVGIPIEQKRVVLRATDSAYGQVRRIGEYMNWKMGQCFRLEIGDGSKLKVDGDMIDPSEDPAVQRSFWALVTGMGINAIML